VEGEVRAGTASDAPARLSVDQWLELPEDQRCELVEGEIIMSPSPNLDHQRAVRDLLRALDDHARAHGGEAFVAPLGVRLSDDTALEPDLLFVSSPDRYGPQIVEGPPDLVVEVSSPSTRRYDLLRKRRLYERFGVPEYWFIDLDAERIEVYTVGRDGHDEAPTLTGRGGTVTSRAVPGLVVTVDAVLPAGSEDDDLRPDLDLDPAPDGGDRVTP
jgi:Uma2 family endonuclease